MNAGMIMDNEKNVAHIRTAKQTDFGKSGTETVNSKSNAPLYHPSLMGYFCRGIKMDNSRNVATILPGTQTDFGKSGIRAGS